MVRDGLLANHQMSLMICPECKKEISNQADACPYCGAKPSLGKAGKYIAGALILAIIWGLYTSPQKPEKTPEEIAATKAENARFSTAKAMSKDIQSALRDPESLKFDTMAVNTDSTVACASYRAKNGFGGMNREIAVYANGTMSNSQKSWDKHCSAGKMFDLLYAVK